MITTPTFDPDRTLAGLVTDDPARAATLDRLGVDYCCHGQRSLADACATAGLTIDDVTAALAAAGTSDLAVPPTDAGPGVLADHIEATHHAYLHAELPALVELAHKVHGVHGERHAELADVECLVGRVHAELVPHLATEEQVVFPAIRADAAAIDLAGPVEKLRAEHEALGAVLAALRATTGNYQVPPDGCASYRSLFQRLARLEADTHLHIHLENNLLFPVVTHQPGFAR